MSAATMIQAVTLLLDVVNVATEATAQAQKIGKIIQAAQTEGRELTEAEWAILNHDQKAAMDRLRKAIK